MPKILIDLSDAADKNVRKFMLITDIKSKRAAALKLLEDAIIEVEE